MKVINSHKSEATLISKLATAGSILAIAAGVFGMFFCLPFLFSPVMEDLVGAGFPFVGGAILFASGLISLSIQSKPKPQMTANNPS